MHTVNSHLTHIVFSDPQSRVPSLPTITLTLPTLLLSGESRHLPRRGYDQSDLVVLQLVPDPLERVAADSVGLCCVPCTVPSQMWPPLPVNCGETQRMKMTSTLYTHHLSPEKL